MTHAKTPAIERAAVKIADLTGSGMRGSRIMSESALLVALDIDEITETLAREQWNRLPLVESGQMEKWDDVETDVERNHFRARVRPYAEAVRRSVVGA